jgi:hypothetical protein
MTGLTPEQREACSRLFATAEPCGVDLRYDDSFEQLKVEIGKLTLPEAGVKVDWPGVRARCIDILSSRSKDLTVSAYLCAALLVTDGMAGLASGVGVLCELVSGAWEGAFPPAARTRQRKAVFEWLLDRLGLMLREGQHPHTAETAEVIAHLQRLEGSLRQRLPEAELNFEGLVAELVPRRVLRPEIHLSGDFLLQAAGNGTAEWRLTPAAERARSGNPYRGSAGPAIQWLEGAREAPSDEGAPPTRDVRRWGFVLAPTAGEPESALGVLWAGNGSGSPTHWYTSLPELSDLEALDVLDRLLDRLPPGEVEQTAHATLAHDLAWGLRDVSEDMFARSLFGERRGSLWPRLLSRLEAGREHLVARLPASDLLTRMVWQQLLSRRHHPAILGAKIWLALWHRLGGAAPASVLVSLAPTWETLLVTRPLGRGDLDLLLGAGSVAGMEDLGGVPEGEPSLESVAIRSGRSLGELLAS